MGKVANLSTQWQYRWCDSSYATAAADNTAITDHTKVTDLIVCMAVGGSNGGTQVSSDTVKVQWRKDSGTWTDLSGSGEVVFGSATNFSQGGSTTQKIGTGPFTTFVSSSTQILTSNSVTTSFSAADQWNQVAAAVDFSGATDSSVYEFRVYNTTTGAALTLDGTVSYPSVTLAAGASPQSVLLDSLTVPVSAKSVGTTEGAVSVLLDALTAATSVKNTSITAQPADINIPLDALSIPVNAQTVGTTTEAIGVTLTALSAPVQVQSLGLTLGTVATQLDALSITTSPQIVETTTSVDIGLDALQTPIVPADVSTTSGEVSAQLDSLTVPVSVQTVGVTSSVQIALDALNINISPENITLTPDSVSITLDALSAALVLQNIGVTAGGGGPQSIQLDALTVPVTIRTVGITEGDVTITLDALSVPSTVQNVTVTTGAASVLLDALSAPISLKNITVVAATGGTINAVAGNGYAINTTSAVATLLLPASPSNGDEVGVVDYAGTFNTNNVTVDPNSETLAGSLGDRTLSTDRTLEIYRYIGDAWVIVQQRP